MLGRPETGFRFFHGTVIHPRFSRRCFLCGLLLTGMRLSAESAPPNPGEKLATLALLSPRLKAALSTGLPAYDPAKSTASANGNKLALERANAATGEAHVLPRFMVRESPPPKMEDLLTSAAKLDRYLGPKEGLDRGLLNKVVLRWGDEAVGFTLFDADKNERRAKIRENDVKRLSQRMELLDLASEMRAAGDVDFANVLKRQSDHLFSREPPLIRK